MSCPHMDDYYYVIEEVIDCACEDEENHAREMCPEAGALFFSFLLNTRFEKHYVWTPKEVLDRVKDGKHKDIYEGTVTLSSSVSEDEESSKRSTMKLNHIQALLICANYRAAGCVGKVKLVVRDEELVFYRHLIEKLRYPIVTISPTQARDELRQIHDHFFTAAQGTVHE